MLNCVTILRKSYFWLKYSKVPLHPQYHHRNCAGCAVPDHSNGSHFGAERAERNVAVLLVEQQLYQWDNQQRFWGDWIFSTGMELETPRGSVSCTWLLFNTIAPFMRIYGICKPCYLYLFHFSFNLVAFFFRNFQPLQDTRSLFPSLCLGIVRFRVCSWVGLGWKTWRRSTWVSWRP